MSGLVTSTPDAVSKSSIDCIPLTAVHRKASFSLGKWLVPTMTVPSADTPTVALGRIAGDGW